MKHNSTQSIAVPCFDANDTWTIETESRTVRRTDDPGFEASIIQTQFGSLRDHEGSKIGVEILHLCRTADGDEFVLDASAPYVDAVQ